MAYSLDNNVTTIVFTLTSVFVSISFVLSKTIDYYEQRAQVMYSLKKEHLKRNSLNSKIS
jgi:hypothetical protein